MTVSWEQQNTIFLSLILVKWQTFPKISMKGKMTTNEDLCFGKIKRNKCFVEYLDVWHFWNLCENLIQHNGSKEIKFNEKLLAFLFIVRFSENSSRLNF